LQLEDEELEKAGGASSLEVNLGMEAGEERAEAMEVAMAMTTRRKTKASSTRARMHTSVTHREEEKGAERGREPLLEGHAPQVENTR
jgi:hypothetical protein